MQYYLHSMGDKLNHIVPLEKRKKNVILIKMKEKRYHMASVNWTNEQLQAINEKGSNILVAAAAREWKNSRAS